MAVAAFANAMGHAGTQNLATSGCADGGLVLQGFGLNVLGVRLYSSLADDTVDDRWEMKGTYVFQEMMLTFYRYIWGAIAKKRRLVRQQKQVL